MFSFALLRFIQAQLLGCLRIWIITLSPQRQRAAAPQESTILAVITAVILTQHAILCDSYTILY